MAPGSGVERRLAAIVATDVVGFSRLIGVDEEGTLGRLGALRRDVVDPAIARHRGRIVKTIGDGLPIEFTSVDDGDIFGDGVNIAARLEAICEPGGICLSQSAREQLEGKLQLALEDIGERQLKNIARPVHVYRVRGLAGDGVPARSLSTRRRL